MRQLFKTFFSIALICGAQVSASEKVVRVGEWTLELPARMSAFAHNQFKAEIDGVYHTVVMEVTYDFSFDWESKPTGLTAEEKAKQLLQALGEALTIDRNNMRAPFSGSPGRLEKLSMAAIEDAFLPPASFCGGTEWAVQDKGVPSLEGQVFLMHGYSVICLDYYEGGMNDIDLIGIYFSERYCSNLGHVPLSSFDEMAKKVFKSMRYSKGPPHKASNMVPDIPGSRFGGVLSGFRHDVDAVTFAESEANCFG